MSSAAVEARIQEAYRLKWARFRSLVIGLELQGQEAGPVGLAFLDEASARLGEAIELLQAGRAHHASGRGPVPALIGRWAVLHRVVAGRSWWVGRLARPRRSD